MKNMKLAKICTLSALLLLPFNNSFAATQTTTFTVTSTVSNTCSISTGSNMAFGTYSGAQLDSTASVTVTCTNGTTVNLGLDAGIFSGATVTTRKMTGTPGGSLAYSLFRDSGHTSNWGNTPSTDTLDFTADGTAQSKTIYGRIAASLTPTAASYSDTITATVTY